MKVVLISITPDAEKLIEEAGRTSYLSFDRMTPFPLFECVSVDGEIKIFKSEEFPFLKDLKEGDYFELEGKKWKANKKWRNSAHKFIEMLIKTGHTSVLEHATATFRVEGGSRSFTHQLVRHRIASFTQQSQRYVEETGFKYVIPPSIEKNQKALDIFEKFIEFAKKTYKELRDMGIQKEDARFVLPNAVCSETIISANLREWRHIIELRGHPSAQWEIRKMAIEVLKKLKEKAPSVFFDFEINEEKECVVKIPL
ncbi:MAG: FAD-dependent thymidylate synthase [Candidatus Aminicenantia bacterium]